MPILGISLALTIAIGIGFLMGQQTPPAPDDMSAICGHLPGKDRWADCTALRSAIATEGATTVARWALWLSFGSLAASGAALIGLIIAFMQGQRPMSWSSPWSAG
ncbi:hypothetical protein [Sphingomonas kyeonggiensis]|uniref:hypothetical protein n=1 Tax=Sphingomonas kyeonggiensis TaxID=1268553 RepID=UPI0027D8A138|nr:hypothetical protein [Sphingomonas kyeonggiensis]